MSRLLSQRRFYIALLCALPLAFGFGLACNNDSGAKAAEGSPAIVCTTPQVGDMVRGIVGDEIEVVVLMTGEGVDPHTYLPTQKDIAKLANAKLIVYSGHHLEGKFDAIFHDLGDDIPTFAVAESVPEEKLIEEESGVFDPHIWHDPSLWAEAVPKLTAQLAELKPRRKVAFEKNAEQYRQALLDLHAEAQAEIDSIPEGARVLITTHDAFSYFGRAYGLDVKSVQGISTEAEPSPADIEDLVTLVVKRKIGAIFAEKSTNSKTIEAVVAGAKQQGHTVTLGEPLYSDSMGKPGTEESSYAGMLRANVRAIVSGLGTE